MRGLTTGSPKVLLLVVQVVGAAVVYPTPNPAVDIGCKNRAWIQRIDHDPTAIAARKIFPLRTSSSEMTAALQNN